MLEYSIIEKLEAELCELYQELEINSDEEEREYILQNIQKRNLKLTRLMPNE